MKNLSILKRALMLLLCLTMALCIASCNKAEDDAMNFGPESNDIDLGTNSTDQDDTNAPSQSDKDEPAQGDDQQTDAKEEGKTEGEGDGKTEDTSKEENKTDTTTCEHKWVKATCDTPKTCSKCKATEGEAAGHQWKDATCTAPKTCSVCKATEGEVSHTYKKGVCSCGARGWGYGAWTHVNGEEPTIFVTTLDFDKKDFSSFEYHSEKTFDFGEEGEEVDADSLVSYYYNGTEYLQYEGESELPSYEINGESITVRLPSGGSFTMVKSGKTKATVTEINGIAAAVHISMGATFEYEA